MGAYIKDNVRATRDMRGEYRPFSPFTTPKPQTFRTGLRYLLVLATWKSRTVTKQLGAALLL